MNFLKCLPDRGRLDADGKACRDAVAWGLQERRKALEAIRIGIYLFRSFLRRSPRRGGAVTDWEGDYGLPKDVIKGGLLCSACSI